MRRLKFNTCSACLGGSSIFLTTVPLNRSLLRDAHNPVHNVYRVIDHALLSTPSVKWVYEIDVAQAEFGNDV